MFINYYNLINDEKKNLSNFFSNFRDANNLKMWGNLCSWWYMKTKPNIDIKPQS